MDNFGARAASVSARSFLNHCGEYQRALAILADSSVPPITVMGLLAAHAIELALKAYLVAGGMTDIYRSAGTYMKSFYTVMYQPSSVKISTLRGTRIHHLVQWNRTVPCILAESFKK